jgi:chaperonin cofactor prefoldin
MTDDELRETIHRLELRLERLDTKMDNLEKSLADVRGEMRTMREGLENRLNSKGGNWVASLWGATLAVLIGLLTLWRR